MNSEPKPNNWPEPHEAPKPAKTLAAWMGGKRLLWKKIQERLRAATPKPELYVEPFVGMGGVIFRCEPVANREAVNDRNSEIVNLYRCVQKHAPELERLMENRFMSEADWKASLQPPPLDSTDIERAIRFLTRLSLSYGGKGGADKPTFAHTATGRLDWVETQKRIATLAQRIKKVSITEMDWSQALTQYDRPDTIYYIDPPYPGHEESYGKGMFTPDDFREMAYHLRQLKGKFILSISDIPNIRLLFDKFRIEQAKLKYSVNDKASVDAVELLISNYDTGGTT